MSPLRKPSSQEQNRFMITSWFDMPAAQNSSHERAKLGAMIARCLWPSSQTPVDEKKAAWIWSVFSDFGVSWNRAIFRWLSSIYRGIFREKSTIQHHGGTPLSPRQVAWKNWLNPSCGALPTSSQQPAALLDWFIGSGMCIGGQEQMTAKATDPLAECVATWLNQRVDLREHFNRKP